MGEAEVSIRVMTYNIRHGEGMDGKIDLDRIANFIKEKDLDIVGIQEIERANPKRGFADQPKLLGEKIGYNYAFGPNWIVPPFEFGNACFSRFKIVESKNVPLAFPSGLIAEPRGVLQCKIKVQDKIIHFWITHFGLTFREGVYSAQQIAEWVRDIKEPIILVGDLNNEPGTPALEILKKAGFVDILGEESINTFPSDYPSIRIDFILVRGPWKVKSFEIPKVLYSDHLPIIAELILTD
ncbi:MAG: endonuclease/exonuclease/phosphatase family protein [Dictyoglomaceae bacterium]